MTTPAADGAAVASDGWPWYMRAVRRVGRILGWAFASLVAGCGTLSTKWIPEEAQRPLRAIAPSSVRVLDDLPEGFAKDKKGLLVVAANYPTAEAPHRIVGAIVEVESTHDRELRTSVAKQEAARRGANAIVDWTFGGTIDGVTRNRSGFYAVYVSAVPPQFPDATALLDKAAKAHPGLTARPPVTHEANTNVRFEGRRGECYFLSVVLDKRVTASIFSHGERGARVHLFTSDRVTTLPDSAAEPPPPDAAPDAPLLPARAAWLPIGCALRDGTIELSLERAGDGPSQVQVFQKSISEAALDAHAASREQAWREGIVRAKEREAERRETVRVVCSTCRPFMGYCEHHLGDTANECHPTRDLEECLRTHSPRNESVLPEECK